MLIRPYVRLLPVGVALFLTFACKKSEKLTKERKYHRIMPYSESDIIDTLVWLKNPSRYPGTGSDMHWWTIGADSAVYVVDDDGVNFGGFENYAHVLRIQGIPPHHVVETVTDFETINFRKGIPEGKLLRRYVNGTIAIGNKLYVSIYDYDWNLERNRPYFDSLYYRLQFYNCWENVKDPVMFTNMLFTDNLSLNYGIAGIIVSEDGGKTWDNIPQKNTPQFLGNKFAGLTFVNFGPGYTHVPDFIEPYVYALSNDYSWETGDHLYMARVHKDSILQRQAWQFVAGFDAKNMPYFTKDETKARPVFTDPGHVGHPTISYNYPLKKFILGIYSDTVPHTEQATVAQWRTWDKASEVQFYESDYPWGPWKLFYSEMPFGGKDHSCYLPQIPNTWWSADGTKGYVMFAGDYTGRNFEYYGLMTWPFQLKLKNK